MSKKSTSRGLGRGLSALMSDNGPETSATSAAVTVAAVSCILLSGIVAVLPMSATGQQQRGRKAEADGAEECTSCKHRRTPC